MNLTLKKKKKKKGKVPSLFPNHYPKRKKKSNLYATLLEAKHVQCKNDYLKTCFKFDPEELAHLFID